MICSSGATRERNPDEDDEAIRHSLGSHPINGKPLQNALCARRWRQRRSGRLTCCPYAASIRCARCKLVKYCSLQCMVEHRESHHQLCNSHLLSKETTPFARSSDPHLLPNTPRFKFAHLPTLSNPSFPVYGLLENAGEKLASRYSSSEYFSDLLPSSYSSTALPDHLRFLFPCVYDLRNVLQTVCQVPNDYRGRVSIFMNSAKSDLAIRDVLILKFLCCYGSDGIDIAIALWYSTALTPQQDRAILLAIRQILCKDTESDCESRARAMFSYQRKFPFSRRGSFLEANFSSNCRDVLVGMVNDFDASFEPITQYWERAEETDDIENVKRMCALPAHLASWNRYHTRGLLLPFDTMDTQFTVPNRLRYRRYSSSLNFITRYSNDVLCGWDILKVISSGIRYGASDQDLYGCLFFHIREMMQTFVQKLKEGCIELFLMDFSPKKLAEMLQEAEMSFHRIDACSLVHDSAIDPTHFSQDISRVLDNGVMELQGIHVLLKELSILGEAQSKSRHCTYTLPAILQDFGRLLEKDASKEFPSLLLTATVDWATKVPLTMDFLTEVEAKIKSNQALHRQEYADDLCKGLVRKQVYSAQLTQPGYHEEEIRTLFQLYAPARALMYFDVATCFTFHNEHFLPYLHGLIEQMELKTGLENKTQTNLYRILPRNWYQLIGWRMFFHCTSNVATAPEDDAAQLEERMARLVPSELYYTALFSGCTFLEEFQEWGWKNFTISTEDNAYNKPSLQACESAEDASEKPE